MTPTTFKLARQQLGHSQRGMARVLGMNYRTVQRMETGEAGIAPRTALHVELLLSQQERPA